MVTDAQMSSLGVTHYEQACVARLRRPATPKRTLRRRTGSTVGLACLREEAAGTFRTPRLPKMPWSFVSLRPTETVAYTRLGRYWTVFTRGASASATSFSLAYKRAAGAFSAR